ncbi:DUF1461 domain-containing protein [Ectothiorhodospiraceae bacterium WFHF3C12]|nr:DUF1461 domain-containing protein [Ectothiorhodospiraceae bacterium WFHF3C12]
MLVSGLLGAAYLAWLALSAVDFGYPWLYDALEIDAHIERFGPQNRYREGFEQTSDARRIALFGGIVDAINNGGRGLEALSYRPGTGRQAVPLLRQPEIEHLRLVGELVAMLRALGAVALGVFIALVGGMAVRRIRPARLLPVGGMALGGLAAGALVFASFDVSDTGWFARLHEWVFPPDHQWFFYYQDSLMTTLMKAPDLFGPMAAALGLTTCVFYAALLGVAQWILGSRGGSAT